MISGRRGRQPDGDIPTRKMMVWKCEPCGFHRNFLSKTECFKCSEPKGNAVDYELPDKEERKEQSERKNMGWKCRSCGFPSNFASNLVCFKC